MPGGCLIRGGRIWHPSSRCFQQLDMMVAGGHIVSLHSPGSFSPGEPGLPEDTCAFDARSSLVFPALCDLHTHLRDPGQTERECLSTGMQAALQGGFSVICAMPNTHPVLDTSDRVRDVANRAAETGLPVRVMVAGAITAGQCGTELADLAGMYQAGASFFTDDGSGVQSDNLIYQAFRQVAHLGGFIMEHCELAATECDAIIHNGQVAQSLGLRGLPPETETAMLTRDIRFCSETGGRFHAAHLSTAESVRLVAEAKEANLPVTAEVNPHHLIFNEQAIARWGSVAKVNPPLRREEDRLALIAGLRSGVIDILATDHAPHTMADKARPFKEAPCGISALETAWSALHTHLVKPGVLDWATLVEGFSQRPRRLLGLEPIRLEPGFPAEFFIFDPGRSWLVTPESLATTGKNTPFLNQRLDGAITMTYAGGKPYGHKNRLSGNR